MSLTYFSDCIPGGSRGPHNTSSHPHHPHDSKGQRSNQTGWQEHNYRSGNKVRAKIRIESYDL